MSDASLIRTILARECDTVNEYEKLAAQAEDPAVRRLILHFAEEEKEHIAECAMALAGLDPAYKAFLSKPLSHIDPALDAGTHEPTTVHAAPAGSQPTDGQPAATDSAATTDPAATTVPAAARRSPAAASATAAARPPVTEFAGGHLINDPFARTVGSLFRAAIKR